MAHTRTPDFMPLLSPGRHRNPRKGACFMEMASYLAGERWSDHPRCTQPLLAAMARGVNDCVGDAARQTLTPLIPEVVGLRSDDVRLDVWIASEAALSALPIVSMEHQRVVAVGILRCEAVLAELDGRPAGSLSARSRRALTEVPDAEQWAREFCTLGYGPKASFSQRSAPVIVRNAIVGIAQACVPDPDAVLVDLLRRTVAGCREMLGAGTQAAVPASTERAVS